jgi:hypothetical protein
MPANGPKPPKRPAIPHTDAETLDGPGTKGSNHPTMDGFYPFRPLNPLHPRADGETVAAGVKKRFPISNPNLGEAIATARHFSP